MRVAELGEFVVTKTGSTNPSYFPKEQFEYYSIPAYDNGEPETTLGSSIGSSKKNFLPGDVLLSRIVPHIRRCWIVPENNGYRQIGSGEWIVFRTKDIAPSFLRFYLMSDAFNVKFMMTIKGVGGSLMRADPNQVKRFKLSLPPLEEQKKIAAILDAAADYRQKTKALIEKYDQLTQSLFLDMFGHLLQTQSNTITLEELCGKGKYGSGASAIEYDDSLPRYVRITDINESGDLNNKKMSPSEFDEQYILKNHDLLFARTGATVGKTYLYKESDGELIYAGYLIKFKIPKPHNASYFFHFTKTNYYKSWVDNQQNVVAQPNINARQYGNELAIPLPSIELQNQFAERVAQVEQQKQQAEAALVKAEDLFNSLLQKAFKGELTN